MRASDLARSTVVLVFSVFAVLGASAVAGPITVQFSGSTLLYSDFPASTPITERIGAKIYGYLIYDVRNAETTSAYTTPSGGEVNLAESYIGCPDVYKGNCSVNWGSGQPILTEYGIVMPWGTFSQLVGDYGTETRFTLSRSPDLPDYRDLYERVDATRDDRLSETFADGTVSSVMRQLSFTVFNHFSHEVLFGDISDLSQLPSAEPDPTNMSWIYGQLNMWNWGQDCQDNFGTGCVPRAGNYFMVAKLDEVSFQRGVHRIPEPSSLALLGLGLAGLAATRRRKH